MKFRRHLTAWMALAAGLVLSLWPGVVPAHAYFAGDAVVPVRTPSLVMNHATGLCAQRAVPLASSRALTMQSCDKANPAQWFFLFEDNTNVDLRFVRGISERARLVHAYNEILAFTGDHVVGTTYGVPGSMMVLGSDHGDPLGAKPIALPPAGGVWNLELVKSPYGGFVFRLKSQPYAYCLSSVGHSKTIGTPVVAGECDPDKDVWAFIPLWQ